MKFFRFIFKFILFFLIKLLLTPVVLVCIFFLLVIHSNITHPTDSTNFLTSYFSISAWTSIAGGNINELLLLIPPYLEITLVLTIAGILYAFFDKLTEDNDVSVGLFGSKINGVIIISILFATAFLTTIFSPSGLGEESVLGSVVVFWIAAVALYLFYEVFQEIVTNLGIFFFQKISQIPETPVLDIVHAKDNHTDKDDTATLLKE